MRYVILDTETTGLDPRQGHRLIEIGAVEMLGRQLTGEVFHYYLNPEREVEEEAQRIHGISDEFLKDKPLFAEVVDALWTFCKGAELVIHNASFDMGFINHELGRLGRPPLNTVCTVRDTLKEARQLYPGKRNNLDALCERLGVNSSHREKHGALLDAELLAEVFLAMTRGQQSLIAEEEPSKEAINSQALNTTPAIDLSSFSSLKVITPAALEIQAHEQYLQGLKGALWESLPG
jgi:DNA polymerase III subunit epsilon